MWRLYLVLGAVFAHRRGGNDLSLWIDRDQVKMFSGYSMEIYAIADGRVLPYILDANFEKHLPVIPSEVSYVNFTWKSGARKYYYNFDRLDSSDPAVLEPPVITIERKGRVPRKPKAFSVLLACSGNSSGVAAFGVGLSIESGRGRPLPGTPLRFDLRKECAPKGPDPECDKKCANGGRCNGDKMCQCREGYMGRYCGTALCYPRCVNNGTCTAPGLCTCPPGFQGRHCEGGICAHKCENGGKCVQKDTCECPRGYYGLRCEFSKCIVPCLNGGKCKGVNKCRCVGDFGGDHCEILRRPGGCPRTCGHGVCRRGACLCDKGWSGKLCRLPAPDRHRSSASYYSDEYSSPEIPA